MANKYTNRELLDYNFNESDYDNVNLAKQNKVQSETKYNSVGEYKNANQDALSKASDALTNRKAFSYDLNADALYQQYKDQYMTQGKLASQDVMGQAAAMTGGYASSYAATVGNQAYQGYLQGLNDKVPELYQLAMQRYNMEGDNLKTAYDVLKGEDETAYGRFMDNKSALFNEMQYNNTLYDSAYNQAQTNYNNKINSNNEAYWNEYTAGYTAEQDAIANDLAFKNYGLNAAQLHNQEIQNSINNKIAKEQLQIQKDSQKIAELQAGVVRDAKGNIVSVASNTGSSGYTLTKEQEERLYGYINNKDWKNAEKYIDAMKANGLTDEQASYWLQLLPESYFGDDPFDIF